MCRRKINIGKATALTLYIVFCGLAACGKASSTPGATGMLAVRVVTTGPATASGAPTTGHPVAATAVTIQTMTGQSAVVAKTDANGNFTVSLAPGTYWVLEPTLGIYGKIPQKHQVTITTGKTTNLVMTIDTSNSTMPPTS